MQEKESIKAVLGQIENSVTQDNCSASLGKLRDAKHPCDGICNLHLTQLKILIGSTEHYRIPLN